jgi:ABC-2 type transport system permease protein
MLPKMMLVLMGTLLIASYLLLWSTTSSLSASEVAQQEDHLRLANAPKYGMDIAYQVGVLITVIVAASSIATEYTWGTIRTVLARTGHRFAFLLAKLSAIGIFIVGTAIVGALGVAIGSLLVTVFGGLDSNLGKAFLERAGLAPLRMVIVLLPYASLSFLVALWSRTTAAGIVVVVVAFYAEVLFMPMFQAGGALSWFPENALIYENIKAVLEVNAITPDQSLPNAWLGTGVLAAYTAAFLALAGWRFGTRDVTLN